MGSRWLNATIVLFWMSTMTWLFWEKVLPSLLQGEPPSYEAMLPAADGPTTVQVDWKVFWNEQQVGVAIGRIHRGHDGIVEVDHHVRLQRLPLPKALPFIKSHQAEEKYISMDVDSKMTFDKQHRLLSFNSTIGAGNRKDLIEVTGVVVQGDLLKIDFRAGGGRIASTEKRLPEGALVEGQLSPLGAIRGLHVGQKWTVPVFTYFNFNEPMEMLHAEVERREHIVWNGVQVNTHLVVYRTDPAIGLGQGGEIRKKLWVREDGAVLQQSIKLLDHWLEFVRAASEPPEPTDGSAVRPSAVLPR